MCVCIKVKTLYIAPKQKKLIQPNFAPFNYTNKPKMPQIKKTYKSYCSTVHFRRITSIHQPTNAHIISHKTL